MSQYKPYFVYTNRVAHFLQLAERRLNTLREEIGARERHFMEINRLESIIDSLKVIQKENMNLKEHSIFLHGLLTK